MNDKPFLVYERHGGVMVLTMNQPEVRNALTGNSAIPEFVAACERINDDNSVRAVVLTGAGTVFCSGGNVKDMRRFLGDAMNPQQIREDYRRGIQRLTTAMYNLEVPSIAAVNGAAIGAGCDLACMCDIRIASESAKFAESFVRMGLIPGDGGAWLLPRIVGMSRACEMSFTGELVAAKQAERIGLVSTVVPDDTLMQTAMDVEQRIASNPGQALRMSKKLIREGQHLRLDSLLEMSASMQAMAHKTAEHEEAINAFSEKRAPNFQDE